MVNKIFCDDDNNELKTLHNRANKCYIEICSDTDRHDYYTGWIALNKSDLLELINELTITYNSMPDGEAV